MSGSPLRRQLGPANRCDGAPAWIRVEPSERRLFKYRRQGNQAGTDFLLPGEPCPEERFARSIQALPAGPWSCEGGYGSSPARWSVTCRGTIDND